MAQARQKEGLFGSRARRICGVAAASTAREMARQVRAALLDTPTIEIRLDWLRNDLERQKLLGWLRSSRLRATLIATCRRIQGGGHYRGDPTLESTWLSAAAAAGCQWCDVEIETARDVSAAILQNNFSRARVLVSFHDFEGTPSRLERFLAKGSPMRVSSIKVAAQARTLADSLRLLRLAKGRGDVVAVPMGEAGLPARILALREGSALAYAPVAEATAPGQVSLHDLKHLYRAHKLTRRTRVYGVIGNPVGHSLGPLMHNTGFIRSRIDAVYLPFLVRDISDFLRAVQELGICGFSVTVPHKQSILRHLDQCDPFAAEIGAVNTVVVRPNGKLYGSNTDYVGVLRALAKRLRLKGSRVLIFGAGGAARAAAFALARAEAVVAVCARKESRARRLARAAGGEAVPRRALRTEHFDAILNATPVGMHPLTAISPLSARELNCRVVMDLIYRPMKTQLLKLAERRGCQAVSGVEMFLAQGFAQWQIWTEKSAPEAAMRRAVLAKLLADERAARIQTRNRGRASRRSGI